MFTRARHRRSFAAMPTAADRRSPARMLVFVCIGIVLVLWGGYRALQALGIFNQVQRAHAAFTVLGGDVNVSLEGAELRRANDAKLYADDRIVSNTGGRGQLSFFDGSLASLEERTDVTILHSERGTKTSYLTLQLQQGTIAVYVPLETFSGSIIRIVRTPTYEAVIPAGTLATFSPRELQVAESHDLGVSVTTLDGEQSAYIGEGQKLSMPDGTISGSLYAYRSLLDAENMRLLAGLRAQAENASDTPSAAAVTASGSSPVTSLAQDELTISEPANNTLVTTSTVTVRGQAGPAVQRVRINGHDVKLDPSSGAFMQELSVSKGETMDILAEALDVRDVTIAQQQRTIRLKAPELGKAAFTSPAADGAVYRTNKAKFEIRGTAPAGAAGIVVNDYRLQLFKKGDTQWAYLANADLGNIVAGNNLFTVYAVDEQGNKGPAATMTIVYDPSGDEGVVSTTGGSASVSSAEPEQADETTLPKNAPLAPGSLTITAPTTGEPYTGTDDEILIEGTTTRNTDSIWVNGYKLRLYKPGVTFWNYYARTQYATLKSGTNTYVINARNAAGEIIDSVTYVINR